MGNVVRFKRDDKLLEILDVANQHARQEIDWQDCKREVIAVLAQMNRADIESLTFFLYPMTNREFRKIVLDWLDNQRDDQVVTS